MPNGGAHRLTNKIEGMCNDRGINSAFGKKKTVFLKDGGEGGGGGASASFLSPKTPPYTNPK